MVNIKYKTKEQALNAKRESQKRSYYRNRDKVTAHQREYYQLNKERIAIIHKAWKLKNKEYWANHCRLFRQKHKKRLQALKTIYIRNRMQEDKSFRLIYYLRRRIWGTLNRGLDEGKTKPNILYGIDVQKIVDKLMKELPKDFEFGKYHVDHIIPIACFDLNNPEQLKECFAPENHQWLLAQDNLNKSDKILEQHLPIYNKLKERFNIR